MNMLSGCELVAKGTTKIDATLPELGLKDVIPNGTWLEQKQTEAAIEARKRLIEVERIEKSGALSHAVWQEELMLAEVTQKVGGHWQYLGHNVGPQLYLRPEETLFMMELNCLHLKFNNVQVSLQQAYSLLLGRNCTHQQYKVYASLSRLGYRVFRHHTSNEICNNTNNNNKEGNCSKNIQAECATVTDKISAINNNLNENSEGICQNIQIKQEILVEEIIMDELKPTEVSAIKIEDKEDVQSKNNTEIETESTLIKDSQENPKNNCCDRKLVNLKNRKLKPCHSKIIQKYFNNLPELIGSSTVIIKKPHSKYLPDNMNIKKEEYSLNLQNIRSKGVRTDSSLTNIYGVGDEVNGNHIRRLSNTSSTQIDNSSDYNNYRYTQNMQYRPFNMWRDRNSFNYFNLSMLFQKHFSPSWYSNPQGQFFQRNHPFPRPSLSIGSRNLNQNRKRSNGSIQQRHLESIKRLSAKLKLLLLKGNISPRNIQSLQKLIQHYNRRYKTKIRINANFDIIDENVLDTIDLDDDEPLKKRQKTNENDPNFVNNLDLIKQLASRLNDLEVNNKSTGRHRRAISKLLKVFNESYNEEYCLTENHEIKNMRQIILDTSESESDCCINEDNQRFPKRKKVKNPFNILKRLADKQKSTTNADASTSNDCEVVEIKKYSDVITKTFSDNWLPKEDDFGRAEIVENEGTDVCVHDEADMRREKLMYDFIKLQSTKSDNWLNLKISFYQSFEQAIAEFQANANETISLNPSVGSDNSSNMASVLKNLSIIKNDTSINEECNLKVDFDVYTRDVKNFKKNNPPPPHFRLVVLDQSSGVPSGGDIAKLESKYGDDVMIIFAIVEMNSIGYIQIKPTTLPTYISNEN